MNTELSYAKRIVSGCIFLLATFVCSNGWSQTRVPNVQGSYVGLFANAATGRTTTAILPYIEQDNAILAGSIQNDELGFLDAFGTIHPNDKCNLISVGTVNAVYKATWERFDEGSGALTGPISATSSLQKLAGPLVLLRRFTGPEAGRPSISGAYAGIGASSTVSMLISPNVGVQNANVEITANNVRSSFAAVFDRSATGKVLGVGVLANGNILHISGQIKDGTSNTLLLNLTITNSAGKLLHTDSIIAILIGL